MGVRGVTAVGGVAHMYSKSFMSPWVQLEEGSLKRVGEPRVKGYKRTIDNAKTGSCGQLIYVNVKSGGRQSRNLKDLQNCYEAGVCGREMGRG